MKADLSLIGLFTNAGLLVQIVMLILFGLSVFSWSLIIQRSKVLKEAKQALAVFQDRFNFNQDLNRLYDYLSSKRGAGQGIEQVFRAGFREFAKLYKQDRRIQTSGGALSTGKTRGYYGVNVVGI